MRQAPGVGVIVHYVSYGSPNGEYTSQCRAAIVTGDGPNHLGPDARTLAVLNPEGLFFNPGCEYHDGAGTPGSPDCPNAASHGNPFRYCACGWIEASLRGGTWHWAQHIDGANVTTG